MKKTMLLLLILPGGLFGFGCGSFQTIGGLTDTVNRGFDRLDRYEKKYDELKGTVEAGFETTQSKIERSEQIVQELNLPDDAGMWDVLKAGLKHNSSAATADGSGGNGAKDKKYGILELMIAAGLLGTGAIGGKRLSGAKS